MLNPAISRVRPHLLLRKRVRRVGRGAALREGGDVAGTSPEGSLGSRQACSMPVQRGAPPPGARMARANARRKHLAHAVASWQGEELRV